MYSGNAHQAGKVVKITPEGVEVQTVFVGTDHEIVHFDARGASYFTESELLVKDPRDNGTFECGPWILDIDMPFAERKA